MSNFNTESLKVELLKARMDLVNAFENTQFFDMGWVMTNILGITNTNKEDDIN